MSSTSTRRTILASGIALAASGAAKASIRTEATDDPFLPAIARWREAEARFHAVLNRQSTAQKAILAHGWGFSACVELPAGECRAHDQIRNCFKRERDTVQTAIEWATRAGRHDLAAEMRQQIETGEVDEAACHAELDRRVALIAQTEAKFEYAQLEEMEGRLGGEASDALTEAFSICPTTVPGLLEYLTVFAEEAGKCGLDALYEPVPQTLIAATKRLLVAAD